MPPNPDRLLEEAARAKQEGRTEDFQVLMRVYKKTAQARATAERSVAMGGEFPSEGEVVLAEQAAPIDALPSGAAAVAAGAAALTFGWLTARRTLLAARPRLTRRWLGVLGPVVWRCGRCSTEVALGADRCGVCGQYQTWPKWTRAPHQ